MALRIKEVPETTAIAPKPVYPDVDIYLEQNDDGSVDVVTQFAWGGTPARLIRFFDDGSAARLESYGTFHKRDSEGLVIIN